MTDTTTSPAAQTPPQPPSAEPEQKDFLTALLLSIFLGMYGVDRFYMGYIGTGILKLITFGGCGIWYIIDVILIATKNLKDANGLPLKEK